jgi:hypothetical protein
MSNAILFPCLKCFPLHPLQLATEIEEAYGVNQEAAVDVLRRFALPPTTSPSSLLALLVRVVGPTDYLKYANALRDHICARESKRTMLDCFDGLLMTTPDTKVGQCPSPWLILQSASNFIGGSSSSFLLKMGSQCFFGLASLATLGGTSRGKGFVSTVTNAQRA